jgi:hypothetical protein
MTHSAGKLNRDDHQNNVFGPSEHTFRSKRSGQANIIVLNHRKAFKRRQKPFQRPKDGKSQRPTASHKHTMLELSLPVQFSGTSTTHLIQWGHLGEFGRESFGQLDVLRRGKLRPDSRVCQERPYVVQLHQQALAQRVKRCEPVHRSCHGLALAVVSLGLSFGQSS